MIKNCIKIFLLVFMIFSMFSCKTPPKEMESINLLEWLNELLMKLNSVNLNEGKQKKFIEEEIQSQKTLILFKKNYTINFNTIKDKESNFIYSIDNNSFILKRPIYITLENKETYIALDINKNSWFKLKLFGTGSNIQNDYNFKCTVNENKDSINVDFTSALRIKKRLKEILILKKAKKLIKLSPNMALTKNNDKKAIFIDLNKVILFIPANTIFIGEINIDGNIITANKNQKGVDIIALKDIFIYINKRMLNISFDRDDWSLSLSSIDFLPKLTIKSINENTINFVLDVKLASNEKIISE